MDHRGEIVRIGEEIVVRMSARSEECAGCAIAAFCSRPAEVKVPPFPGAEIGRNVVLKPNAPVRGRSIWMLVVVPLVLFMAALVACVLLALPEWVSALASLGGLVVWYAVIGLTMGRQARFVVEKML